MKTGICKTFVGPLLAWCLSSMQLTFAQTGSLALQGSEAATEQSSYAARVLNRKGVREVDPNVYVYGPEFAKRFQMPQEWVSDELKGVDAVAFRVVPGYKTCGWGGNPLACREDEVRCEMDMYFDHQRHPLPWDERRPQQYSSVRNLSAYFLWAGPKSNHRQQQLSTPPRPDDSIHVRTSPFIDPKTGKGLGWQYFTSTEGRSGHGWLAVVGYDRQIFTSTALLTIGARCGYPVAALVMTSDGTMPPFNANDSSVYKSILLPNDWQDRVTNALKGSEQRSNAFFKEQGEKALKALKERPVPNKAIVPLQ